MINLKLDSPLVENGWLGGSFEVFQDNGHLYIHSSLKDGNSEKNIQDDATPGSCDINRKRVDREWGEWEPKVIELQYEYKDGLERSMVVDSAHGGFEGSREKEQIKQWLQFVPFEMTWLDAKAKCEHLGGKLFSDLDGTPGQLDFFVNQFGFSSMWMGVYRATVESTQFITTDGEVVPLDLLFWDPNPLNGQPDYGNHQYVLIYVHYGTTMQYLHDYLGSGLCPSLCDLK